MRIEVIVPKIIRVDDNDKVERDGKYIRVFKENDKVRHVLEFENDGQALTQYQNYINAKHDGFPSVKMHPKSIM